LIEKLPFRSSSKEKRWERFGESIIEAKEEKEKQKGRNLWKKAKEK